MFTVTFPAILGPETVTYTDGWVAWGQACLWLTVYPRDSVSVQANEICYAAGAPINERLFPSFQPVLESR